MKKTIKMLTMVAVMFAAVSTAQAQDAQQQGRRGGGGGRGPNVAAILKDSLKVSDAVAAKADSIVKAYGAKQAELRNGATDMAAIQPKMMELRTQQTADIKALL